MIRLFEPEVERTRPSCGPSSRRWYPDLEADRVLLEHLQAGNYDAWRDLPLEKLEASGQHEVLNWVCLAGAMAELGYTMRLVDWVETWIFNAPKCLAVFR